MDLSSVSIGLIAIVLPAIALGSLIKGITGLGLPLVAVPAIASFTSVEEAVVLMIIPIFGSNLWLVTTHRRFRNMLREHVPFLIAGFFGGIGGTFLLVAIEDRWLKLLLAAWLALYLVQYFLGDLLRFLFRARGAASAVIGLTAGTVQGATGISSHIVAPFFHGRGLRPDAYAFLIASAFLSFSAAQLIAAAERELFTSERLVLGLGALVPTLLFTQLGVRLAPRVPSGVFQALLLTLFVLMEIKLIADIV